MEQMPSFTKKDFEVSQREILYKGKFCLVRLCLRHRLFEGDWSKPMLREVLERSHAAAVLPYDPKRDHVVLIEQFRPGAIEDPKSPWQIEIPAGVFNHNEEPEDVAIREAKEEADCDITQLELIYDYFVSPGGSNEYIHVYCGLIDSTHVDGVHGLDHEDEDIRVLNIPFSEAMDKLKRREIKNAPALISLQWLALNRARFR